MTLDPEYVSGHNLALLLMLIICWGLGVYLMLHPCGECGKCEHCTRKRREKRENEERDRARFARESHDAWHPRPHPGCKRFGCKRSDTDDPPGPPG